MDPSRETAQRRRRRNWVALTALAILASAFNVTKAVHIDDTAHLEIVGAILRAPLHPMTALVNWDDTAEPIHHLNQPHLLFYVMAATAKLAGPHTELALHLLSCAFSGAAILLFFALANALAIPHALGWTALFCLGPAFVPAQNLMVDVPLVALWLGFFYALATAPVDRPSSRLWLAALCVGAACLVKYTSLALLPVFAVALILRPRRNGLVTLLVPLALLAAWSLLNWTDYGAVHLLGRPMGHSSFHLGRALGSVATRALLWLIGLGSVCPIALVLLATRIRATGRVGRLAPIAGALALLTIVLGRFGLPTEPVVQSVLRGLFFGNGLLLVGFASRALALPSTLRAYPSPRLWPAAGAIAAAAFIVSLAPFLAIRHVLLSLPGLLLALAAGQDAQRLRRGELGAAVVATALLGVALALSDWKLADVYRRRAHTLASQSCAPDHRCYALGHWGWQWYATRRGFTAYDERHTQLRPGDRLVIPELAARQKLRPEDARRLIRRGVLQEPATMATLLRTVAAEHSPWQGAASGGLYYYWTSIPWTVSRAPLETFDLFEVRPP